MTDRHDIRAWMLDAANWHPLSGVYVRTYDDEGVRQLLDGATIRRDDDAGGPVIVTSGWLSKKHGVDGKGEGYPFFLVREKGEEVEPIARHMLFLPTRPYHDGDELHMPVEDVADFPTHHDV